MIRIILLSVLLLPSLAKADDFDFFMSKISAQSQLTPVSVGQDDVTLKDKKGDEILVTRPGFVNFMKDVAKQTGFASLAKLISGGTMTKKEHYEAQKALVYTSNTACVATGAQCAYVATTSVVFWPNGVIALACAAAIYSCQKYTSYLIDGLDEMILAEDNKAKILSGGGGDPQRPTSTPPAGVPGALGGGTVFERDRPKYKFEYWESKQ